MKVLLFGATGMIGQGVLRECLQDSDVTLVQTVGRSATGAASDKLREIVHKDMWDYSAIEPDLQGFDACFFCLGVTSAGMNEGDYSHITYDLTIAAASTLARLNPKMVFVFVSGLGADATEQGKLMWARVKGKTENALLRMRFGAVYVFRPGFIQPLHGIQSRTRAYRVFYIVAGPLMPILRWAFPSRILTTEMIGKVMLSIVRQAPSKQVLEGADIAAVYALRFGS